MSSLVKVAQENVFVSGPFPTEKIDKDFERSDSTIEGPSLSTSLIINQYNFRGGQFGTFSAVHADPTIFQS